jgi:hypothetical protein
MNSKSYYLLDQKVKAEIAKRPSSLRLPHQGFRFRALLSTNVDIITYLGDSIYPQLRLAMDIRKIEVKQGDEFVLEYEPNHDNSIACALRPQNYQLYEDTFIEASYKDDINYKGYCISVSYIQLDKDFEWIL